MDHITSKSISIGNKLRRSSRAADIKPQHDIPAYVELDKYQTLPTSWIGFIADKGLPKL